MMEDAITHLTDRVNAKLAQVTKEFLIGVMKRDEDHKFLIIRNELKRAIVLW